MISNKINAQEGDLTNRFKNEEGKKTNGKKTKDVNLFEEDQQEDEQALQVKKKTKVFEEEGDFEFASARARPENFI